MNKKKVIELIGNVEKYLLAYEKSGKNADIAMAFQQLHEAQDEVQKPEWISVEDELPFIYEDGIIVCNKDFPNDMRFAHRIPGKKNSFIDSSNFIRDEYSLPATHWRKIDKLEV